MTENELLLADRLAFIREIIQKEGEGNFYLSWSGGKDSETLSRMIDEALPGNKIPRVYINTGIEYLAMLKHVKRRQLEDGRIEIIAPKKPIRQTLEAVGYPFKSKEHSEKMRLFQQGSEAQSVRKYATGEGAFTCPAALRYQFMPGGVNFKISPLCCQELKKKPARQYERESGRKIAILGLRQAEGGQRRNRAGCAVYGKGHKLKKIKPLNPCGDDFIEWYIESRNIRLCELYAEPYKFKRTGCKGCPFAIDLAEELERMALYFPAEREQCEAIFAPVYTEYRKIKYRLPRYEQMRLF